MGLRVSCIGDELSRADEGETERGHPAAPGNAKPKHCTKTELEQRLDEAKQNVEWGWWGACANRRVQRAGHLA